MTDKASAPKFSFDQLIYLQGVNSCDPDDIPEDDLSNKFVMVSVDPDEGKLKYLSFLNLEFNCYVFLISGYGNCSILERAQNLASRKAIGILTDRPMKTKFNVSDDFQYNIIVLSLYQRRDREPLLELQAIKPPRTFFLYAPQDDPKGFDSSLVVILAMAVLTVATGSAWSGFAKKHLYDLPIFCVKYFKS